MGTSTLYFLLDFETIKISLSSKYDSRCEEYPISNYVFDCSVSVLTLKSDNQMCISSLADFRFNFTWMVYVIGGKEIYTAVFSVKQSAFKNGFLLLNFALHSTCEYTLL